MRDMKYSSDGLINQRELSRLAEAEEDGSLEMSSKKSTNCIKHVLAGSAKHGQKCAELCGISQGRLPPWKPSNWSLISFFTYTHLHPALSFILPLALGGVLYNNSVLLDIPCIVL